MKKIAFILVHYKGDWATYTRFQCRINSSSMTLYTFVHTRQMPGWVLSSLEDLCGTLKFFLDFFTGTYWVNNK